MADKMGFSGDITRSAGVFRHHLQFLMKKYLRIYDKMHERLCINKKTRDLMDGDFVIPRGCLPDISQEALCQILDGLKKETLNMFCPLNNIQIDSRFYTCAFFLNRAAAFKNVLTTLWHGDFEFEEKTNKFILLNQVDFSFSQSDEKKLTLDMLRSLILLQHILALLRLKGFNVRISTSFELSSIEKLLKVIGMDIGQLIDSDQSSLDARTTEILINKAKQSCYLEKLINSTGTGEPCGNNSLSPNNEESLPSDSDVLLNLKKYVNSQNYCFGKGHFDKNINLVKVCSKQGPTDVLQQVSRLHQCLSENEAIGTVIHIVPDSQQFTQQKVHLTWKMFNEDKPVSQVHLVYGQVTNRKQSGDLGTMDALEFFRLRYDQMKEAAVIKYGDLVKGSGWEDTITSLTVASLKFEFLHTVCRNTVKLDLSKNEDLSGGGDNRAGSFVMYNCARLSTLFTHFEEAVKKGLYPPLPSIEDIDFSTLKEEDEWYLFFEYIFTYQDILKQTTVEIVPESEEILTKLHTHKICHFLIQLSHSLSSYYSRTHILGESRSHLMQTMYARLYLLKCIHKVMVHALDLMGISAINQL